MKRLVCIVEGEGAVAAIPNLCARILAHLGVHDWVVDPDPIRRKRSALVDARQPRPRRPCREEEVVKAMMLALRRPRPTDDYSPTVHQLQETRRIDIAFLRERSPSFDKLVRSIAALCAARVPPPRP